MAEKKMIEIENPCYHCYEGAVGECMWCKFAHMEWSKDVEAKTVMVKEDDSDDRE